MAVAKEFAETCIVVNFIPTSAQLCLSILPCLPYIDFNDLNACACLALPLNEHAVALEMFCIHFFFLA